jgi:hypothetical protein
MINRGQINPEIFARFAFPLQFPDTATKTEYRENSRFWDDSIPEAHAGTAKTCELPFLSRTLPSFKPETTMARRLNLERPGTRVLYQLSAVYR